MTPRPVCDVLILGGGPAGTSAALALQRRGMQTVVVERTRYASHARPADTLAGDCAPLLHGLGVGIPARAAPILSAWGDGEIRAHPEPGWHVDRSAFDATLARAAEDTGALVYCDARPHAIMPLRRGWRVSVAQTTLDARFVVDATGRSAWFATRAGARRRHVDRLLAFTATFAGTPSDDALLVESVPDGWWYSLPRPGGGALAVYLTDTGRPFVPALAETRHTRLRLDGLVSVRPSTAATQALDRFTGRAWLAVGDAAYTMDPLSGCGVVRAIESGLRAAEAIAHGALEAYHRETESRFAAELQARAHYYGLERRWARTAFWRNRQGD
jgi:flavin-dependent dehydrogenase